MIRHSFAALTIVASVHATLSPIADAQPRLEYRLIHAAPYQLQQVIDSAGRDGFSCVSVARPELDVRLPSVVVTLARPYIETTHVNPGGHGRRRGGTYDGDRWPHGRLGPRAQRFPRCGDRPCRVPFGALRRHALGAAREDP
jgi:hypothetical protein